MKLGRYLSAGVAAAFLAGAGCGQGRDATEVGPYEQSGQVQEPVRSDAQQFFYDLAKNNRSLAFADSIIVIIDDVPSSGYMINIELRAPNEDEDEIERSRKVDADRPSKGNFVYSVMASNLRLDVDCDKENLSGSPVCVGASEYEGGLHTCSFRDIGIDGLHSMGDRSGNHFVSGEIDRSSGEYFSDSEKTDVLYPDEIVNIVKRIKSVGLYEPAPSPVRYKESKYSSESVGFNCGRLKMESRELYEKLLEMSIEKMKSGEYDHISLDDLEF